MQEAYSAHAHAARQLATEAAAERYESAADWERVARELEGQLNKYHSECRQVAPFRI